MIQHKEITIKSDKEYFYTDGLVSFINKEIRLSIGNYGEDEYISVIKYIIDYIVTENPSISEDQTIAYYSWALQFKLENESYYDLYEVEINGEGFHKGCDLAISIISSQSELCFQYGVVPLFPSFSQSIVISNGVYERKDIEAIRYESPQDMCGWWLITDDYDNNIESLMTVHYYHVAFKHPDILKFLALPFGYQFLMENGEIEITKDDENE